MLFHSWLCQFYVISNLAFISTLTDIMIGNKSESIKGINIVQGSQNPTITININI
jgi:hypothetical protein